MTAVHLCNICRIYRNKHHIHFAKLRVLFQQTLVPLNVSLLSKQHSTASFQRRKMRSKTQRRSAYERIERLNGPFTHTQETINSQQHAKYTDTLFYKDSHRRNQQLLFFYDSMHKHINADTTRRLRVWNQLTVFSAHYCPRRGRHCRVRMEKGRREKWLSRWCKYVDSHLTTRLHNI